MPLAIKSSWKKKSKAKMQPRLGSSLAPWRWALYRKFSQISMFPYLPGPLTVDSYHAKQWMIRLSPYRTSFRGNKSQGKASTLADGYLGKVCDSIRKVN